MFLLSCHNYSLLKKRKDFNKDANNSKGDDDISLKLSRYIIYCVGGDDKYKMRCIRM